MIKIPDRLGRDLDVQEIQTQDPKGIYQGGRRFQSRDAIQETLGRIIRHSIPEVERTLRRDPTIILTVGYRVDDWTEEDNSRRCELIDRDIEGTIGASEAIELLVLQIRFYKYLEHTSPLPIDGARKLHEALLKKKREQSG